MFSLDVIDTDRFLEMPTSAQALYFHLGMHGDDDGFVCSPRKIATAAGCCPDDLRLLAAKGYIIPFESGVIVITDWNTNNTLRNDRYRPTRHSEEKSRLRDAGGKYELVGGGVIAGTVLDTNGIPMVNQMEPQHNLTKHNITKPKKNTGAELQSDTEIMSGILLPLVDGSSYDVPQSKIEKWSVAYPGVDVQQELRKMGAWLDSNPTRGKTRRGIDRFINNWLSKEQDKGGRYRTGQQEPERSAEEHIDDVKRYAQYLGNRPPSPDDPFQ